MAASNVERLQRGLDNCTRLYLMVQEVMASPTQSAIDAVVEAAADATLVPKPRYDLDGESYDWPAYAESLLKQADDLQKLIVKLGGNFVRRSLGRV